MAPERENFYILLSLPCDPPEKDLGRIRAALRAKKQEWTRWQDNPLRRNQALSYLGLAQEIERVMFDPARREKEAAGAVTLRAAALRAFEAELRVLESKGYILPKESAAIAEKYRDWSVTEETVREYAKCPIQEEPPAFRRDDRGEALDRVTARTITRNLALLGQASLYTFLEEPPYSSLKKLTAAAEQRRKSAAMTVSAQNTVAQELAGICLRMFESFDSKQRYDNFLKISRMPAVAELLDEELARSGAIGSDVLLRIAGFAVEKYSVRVLEAEEFIRAYCAAYHIPVGTEANRILCPCCGAKTPRDGAVCASCAQPLSGGCPECGAAFSGGPAVCAACGFGLADMGKAVRFLGEAENALIENNAPLALRALQYARRYWPGNLRLPPLEKRAAALEDRCRKYQSAIDGQIAQRRFYAANETIQEALGHRVRLPASTVGDVAKTIAAFEAKLTALRGNPQTGVEELLPLAAVVADSAELAGLLAKHPPAAPASLTAEAAAGGIRLSWTRSRSRGAVSYQLVRKADAAPSSPGDGEVVYEGVSHSFADKTARSLQEYHYAVFSRRGGAYSATAASAGPALLVPGIEGLRAVPMDGAVQLNWTFNADFAGIRIRRAKDISQGDGEPIETARLDGLTDTGIENGATYRYAVSAEYLCGGRRVFSPVSVVSVTPRRDIRPLDEFTVEPLGNDEFLLCWNPETARDILLFMAEESPPFRSGDTLGLEELTERFPGLPLEYRKPGEAVFRLRLIGGAHLFCAVAEGKFASVGKPLYFTHVNGFHAFACEAGENSLSFSFDWPDDIPEAALLWRFDRFPQKAGEPGANEQTITRAAFLRDGGFLLRGPEPKTYYAALYGVFTAPDGGRTYSAGATLLVNNRPRQEIYYQMTFRRRPFSDNGTLSVHLSSPQPFVVPKAVLVGKIGRFPLKRSDGLPLFELDEGQKSQTSASFQFPTSALPQDLHLRLFVYDDSLYGQFLFLPSADVKIT